MWRGEIDGVTVLREDLPGVPAATLTFGCGARDEELDTTGLTHLVQALVGRAEPDRADRSTEGTSVVDTSFTAAGSPEQIAEHFAAVCAAVSDLPGEDLVDAVADADPEDRYLPDVEDLRDPWGSLLARRFGPSGPGLARWPVVDYRLFTADEIRRHVTTYFTGGNAVLATTAAIPADLRLPLPPGPRVSHPTPPVRHQTGPIWYADEVHGPGLSFGAEPGAAVVLLLRVLMTLVQAALDRAGLALTAYPVFLAVDSTRHEFGLTVSPKGGRVRDSDSTAAAGLLWTELLRLVRDGPEQAELDHETREEPNTALPEALRARLASVEWLRSVAELEPATGRELFGTADNHIPDARAELRGLTPAAARDLMSGWLSTATIVVPSGARPSLSGCTEDPCPRTRHVPSGEVLRPPLLKRRRNRGTLVIGMDRISTVDGEGDVHTVPLSDALVAERNGALWLAHTGHGCLTDISDFAGAADKLRSLLPPRRFRRVFG
ncbi:hypothetical protein [Plantactinospora sp. B24E8]|uniref:hypothetical protein n=1 Tax=Plantactinospora sp. B24E8 TaxID=3153567 RepID=UPI00325EC512